MGHDDTNTQIERTAQQQRVAEALVFLGFHSLFFAGMRQQNHPVFSHYKIERINGGIGRVHAHGVGQPLDISDSQLRPRFQLLQRVGAIGMDGNCRRENVGIFIRKLDHVAVRHVHVGLAQIDGAVGVVIFIESRGCGIFRGISARG